MYVVYDLPDETNKLKPNTLKNKKIKDILPIIAEYRSRSY